MQQHLQAWKHSGLSQRAYLDATGVSKTLFSYWQRKLSPELSPTVPDSPGFVAVLAPESAAEVYPPDQPHLVFPAPYFGSIPRSPFLRVRLNLERCFF